MLECSAFYNMSSPNWWRRQWHPTPVLFPGKSHGWRSLVGCSPWGRKESDKTEQVHFHFSLSHIGEGNGNPLQCSCLENPRDGGAAIYGITQSRTWMKWHSSSSSSSPNWMSPICVYGMLLSLFYDVFYWNSRLALNLTYYYISVQFSSVAQSCLTLCDPINGSTPGLPVHHQLPEFTQLYIQRLQNSFIF